MIPYALLVYHPWYDGMKDILVPSCRMPYYYTEITLNEIIHHLWLCLTIVIPLFLIIIMGISIMIWFDYDWMIVSMILYYGYPMDSYPMWASQFLVSKPPIVTTTKTRQRHRNREPSWPTKAYEFTWNPSIKLQKFYTAQVGKGSLLQLGEAPRAMLWSPLRRGWPFWPDSCRLENHHFFS